MDELSFTADDDFEVFYRRWTPDDPVRGVVLIVHGASEHSGRYARFAEVLRDDGSAVYALDLRGHGRTAESTGRGRIGARGVEGLLDDVHELANRARADFPSLPVVLFGHSMGSLIAQVYVERSGDTLAGYVLSGSAGLTEVVPEFATMLHEALNAGMSDEPVDSFGEFGANGDARSRFDWLSRDAEEVDKYVADPWCGDDAPLTYGFVAAMLEPVATSMEPEMLAARSEAPPRSS